MLPVKKMENVWLENNGGRVKVGMGVGVEFRWSEKTFLRVTEVAQ